MKKLWITLIIVTASATTVLFAQEKSPKAMIQDRIEYIKKHLVLTGAENQNFWKVYEEYLAAEMKTMDTYRKNLERQGIKLGSPGTNKELIEKMSDKQVTYMQDQKFELRKNLLNLEATYHKKFKTFMTPHHLQELYNLEYKYKRELTAKKKEAKKEPIGPVNGGKKKR
jgi:hypothetical protein